MPTFDGLRGYDCSVRRLAQALPQNDEFDALQRVSERCAQDDLLEALNVDARQSLAIVTKTVIATASTVFLATSFVASPAAAAATSLASASGVLVVGSYVVLYSGLLIRDEWILKSTVCEHERHGHEWHTSRVAARDSGGGSMVDDEVEGTQEESRWRALEAFELGEQQKVVVIADAWTQTSTAVAANAWTQSDERSDDLEPDQVRERGGSQRTGLGLGLG
jgi:hypothetical protein